MYRAAAAIALLSSLTLVAQNRSTGAQGSASPAAANQAPSTIVLEVPLNSTPVCPIGMRARQGVWDHTITVHQGGQKYKGPFGQRIILTLTAAHEARIVAATVLVRGFNGKNRMLETSSSEGNATKVLRTGFGKSSQGNAVSADLYISGFTAITSVKLQDVTYSDGSTWHADQSNACRVAPDPLMLVAEH